MIHRLSILLTVVALAGLCIHVRSSRAEAPPPAPAAEHSGADAPSAPPASPVPAPSASSAPATTPEATGAAVEPPAPTAAAPESAATGEVRKVVEETPSAPSTPASKQLTFNFRYQPWADVLDWFAEQAGYSLVLDSPPKGTFNYRDDRRYTPAEAIDLLNSVLLTKGYTLVLRDRMLMLVDLEDEIPPSLVTRVSPEDLDRRGRYELVSTRFELKNLSADDAQKEIEKLLGPEGRIVVLPKAQQIVVTETGGRLREIRDVLQRADAARDPAQQEVRWFELHSVSPDEALAMLRQVFEIAEGANTTADGSLRLATDPVGMRLLVSGSPQRLAQVAKILQTVDAPAYGEEPAEPGQQQALQLEVYDVAPADPESVLKVTQTLMADVPGVRLATDPKTGNLIALARPKEQATIQATIDQIRRDAQSVDVIHLRTVDPQLAVLAIGKLFGKDAAQAPSVDADLANRQLLIRGSAGQIAQVRVLLEKMGESFGAAPTLAGGKLRLVPVRGDSQQLIERVREFWPVLGKNELRVVPMQKLPGHGPSRSRLPREGSIDERTPVPAPAAGSDEPDSRESPPSTTWREEPAGAPQPRQARVMFAAAGDDRVDQGLEAPPQGPPSDPGKPPILVLSTPDGLYLSSEDVEALNELQKLIDTLQGGSTSGEAKLTVFYLRNAEAKTVADRLKEILASTGPATTTAGPTPSTPAAAAGILGSIGTAGTFGRITPSGPISITPDSRLNALLVQAAPADVDLIEEILKILDRGDTQEVPAQPKPRLIPVLHTSASEMAKVVKDVYQTRMASNSSSNDNNRGMSPPEMMMRMMRRGGGDSSNSSSSKDAQSKMTIGVDERTNSLVVSAPEPLFEEVRDLVEALDSVASQDQETVEVVTLQESNPEAVRQALASLLGDAVKTSTTSTSSGRSSGASGPWQGFGGYPGSSRFNRSGSSQGGGFPGGGFQGGPSFPMSPFGGGFGRSDRGGRGDRGGRSDRGNR